MKEKRTEDPKRKKYGNIIGFTPSIRTNKPTQTVQSQTPHATSAQGPSVCTVYNIRRHISTQ